MSTYEGVPLGADTVGEAAEPTGVFAERVCFTCGHRLGLRCDINFEAGTWYGKHAECAFCHLDNARKLFAEMHCDADGCGVKGIQVFGSGPQFPDGAGGLCAACYKARGGVETPDWGNTRAKLTALRAPAWAAIEAEFPLADCLGNDEKSEARSKAVAAMLDALWPQERAIRLSEPHV